MNKYEKYYNAIIEHAQVQGRNGYTEKHHIVPRSLGGSDDDSNLVKLTAREHFICHWLLTKFVDKKDRPKMIKALSLMRSEGPYQQRYSTKITARVYENIKQEHAEIIREQNTGWQPTKEQRQKITESKIGKTRDNLPDSWYASMRTRYKGEDNPMYGKTQSEETRRKIGEKIKGTKHSLELIERRISKIRGLKRKTKLCPHCQQQISVNTYPRWHGDRCKEKR